MLNLNAVAGESREILALGAHCDDIEIGCGATMLQLAADPANRITWAIFSAHGARAQEARAAAEAFLGSGPNRRLILHEFRDGFLPWEGAAVKEAFEALKDEVDPDMVFTHHRHDLHQDHRLVCELTWNTFRDHLVLEYEIPKWDGDLAQPNCYVELAPEQLDMKIDRLFESYATQAGKGWFDEDVFRSLARIRGMECRAGSGLAEAFCMRKFILLP